LDAIVPLRIYFTLLLFFLTIGLVHDREQIVFIMKFILIFAILSALASTVQFIFGGSKLLLPAEILGVQGYGGSLRIIGVIRPIYISVIFLSIMLASTKSLGLRIVLIVGIIWFLFVFGLQLTRSYWISILLCLMVVFLFSREKQKRQYVVWLLLIALMAIPLLTPSGIISRTPYAMAIRARCHKFYLDLSKRSGRFYSGSYYARMQENQLAWSRAKSHPITGVGIGNFYFYQNEAKKFKIHNMYLDLLASMGLLGLIPFLWFSFVFIKRAFRIGKHVDDLFLRNVVLTFGITYLGWLISAVGTMTNGDDALSLLAVMMGINEVIYNINGEKGLMDFSQEILQ